MSHGEAAVEPRATEPQAARRWDEERDSPRFDRLVRARRRFVVPALATFVAYSLAFLLVCGYAPGVIAARVVDGFTVGMAAALLYLLLVWRPRPDRRGRGDGVAVEP